MRFKIASKAFRYRMILKKTSFFPFAEISMEWVLNKFGWAIKTWVCIPEVGQSRPTRGRQKLNIKKQ